MTRYHLIHLGVGNVGRTVTQQILKNSPKLRQEHNIELVHCGLFTSSAGIFEAGGLTPGQIATFPGSGAAIDVARCIDALPTPFILIDSTASAATQPHLLQALKRGAGVVLSNKKPLSGPAGSYEALRDAGGNRLFYETTVGAGLPVISTVRDLLATGDQITGIQGCFSGTLGFLFSQLESGSSFSESLARAKQLGYTEPDPRDDLSGLDVARKALILARLLGYRGELESINIEKLYPETMQSLSPDDFLKQAHDLDESYRQKIAQAGKNGQVLRYVATVTPASCRVELKAVEKTTAIGSLQGADNIIVIHSRRYAETPLVIQGPGAGLEVTAAGIFRDILEATKVL